MKNKFLVLAFGLIGMSVSANSTNNSEKGTPKNDFISAQEKKCFTEGPKGEPVEIKCPKPNEPIVVIIIDDGVKTI